MDIWLVMSFADREQLYRLRGAYETYEAACSALYALPDFEEVDGQLAVLDPTSPAASQLRDLLSKGKTP